MACETYKGDWFVYPDVINSPAPIIIPGKPIIRYQGDNLGKITAKNFKNIEVGKVANKRLLFLLGNPCCIDGVVKEPYFYLNYPIDDQGTPRKYDDLIVDGWGNFIRILPGRNHTKDKPVGLNFFHKTRNRSPLDIYSVGENGKDETGNGFTQSTLNTSKADDIVSWYIEKY